MHLEGRLSAAQALVCTEAAELPSYFEMVARLIAKYPDLPYGQAFLQSSCVEGALEGWVS